MKALKHFAEEKFKLSKWAASQKDGRGPDVDIRTSTIFKVLAYQVSLGERSMLGMDHLLRLPFAQRLLNRKRTPSDTTLFRALEGWDTEGLRETLRETYRSLDRQGRMKVTLSTGRRIRACIQDGTDMGGHWMSVLVGIGQELTCGIDAEPYEARGSELPASRRMMDRTVSVLGAGFATHVLYDALMADRVDLAKALRDWKMHLVVKTEEEYLEPIRWAQELFASVRRQRDLDEFGIEVIEGSDPERQVAYTVWTVGDVKWTDLEPRLRVARIEETLLKGEDAGRRSIFWTITTDLSLRAAELRDLAHLRWRIENNLFKELNERVGSKRGYIQSSTVKLCLLLIWFFGWTLFQAFRSLPRLKRRLAGLKITKSCWQKFILFGEDSLLFDSS